LFLLLPLLAAGCAASPAGLAPEASATTFVATEAPFMRIFGRHPDTESGGGALPTAEAAVVRILASGKDGDEGWLDPPAAGALRALLIDPDHAPDERVADVVHALDLLESSLRGSLDQDQQRTAWYHDVQAMIGSLRDRTVMLDRSLDLIAGRPVRGEGRTAEAVRLRAGLQALLVGQDLDGDRQVDPRRETVGLLQLRDALGYAAVVDGEDWNCRVQPEPLEAFLADYRRDLLWCGAPAGTEEVPQS
jgi:hypothetical protein